MRRGLLCKSYAIARHPELIEKWSKIGLEQLIIGMEAVTDDGLKRLNKRSSMASNQRAVCILKQYNVVNMPHFVVRQDFGAEDFEAMWSYIEQNELWMPFFAVLTPLPGSELWKEERHRLLADSFDLFDLAHSVLPANLPQELFVSRYRQLYLRNYSLWRYARKRLSQLQQRFRSEMSEKEKGELPTLPRLIALNVMLRLAFRKIRRNHRLYLSSPSSCRRRDHARLR